MTLSLFGPQATDWLTESRRRMGATRSGYEQAVRDTRRDALSFARSSAGAGSGAAGTRSALQALAPAVGDIRAAQTAALAATQAQLAEDQRLEMERRGNWMNELLGGIAGIAGQMAVPLIGGLGGSPPGAAGAPPGGAPGFPAAPAAPAATAAPAPAPSRFDLPPNPDPVGFAMREAQREEERRRREEEERRRRGGLGGAISAAAPFVGFANPLAGMATSALGSVFR